MTHRIVPWTSVRANVDRRGEIDEIFFQSSNTRSFDSDAARAAFKLRWLDVYLCDATGSCFVSLDTAGAVSGYVIGTVGSQGGGDADLPEVDEAEFVDHLAAYPAHLHVNVHPDARSAGVGAALIEAFATHCVARGATGVHIVTSVNARNRRFYSRQGFREIAVAPTPRGGLVMMGRRFIPEYEGSREDELQT